MCLVFTLQAPAQASCGCVMLLLHSLAAAAVAAVVAATNAQAGSCCWIFSSPLWRSCLCKGALAAKQQQEQVQQQQQAQPLNPC
jgi:hypothetical protein